MSYETMLRAFAACRAGQPLFDVQLLGIGPDGHTASLFPGTPALKEPDAWVTAVIGAKPKLRITLTYPALNSSFVMSVSGSGQTTVATLLAGRLGWSFEDVDDLHPASNIEKMRAGTPLTDADRWPWLQAVAAWMAARRKKGERCVVACSVLCRAYRDILRGGLPDIRLVYLRGDQALIIQRQAARHGYFMPPSLVASQLVALQESTE